MEIVVAVAMLAAVFAALALPLYRGRTALTYAPSGTLNDLLAQRDGVYATLRDLDLDFQLGKLNASDYQTRREKYIARAAIILGQLDKLRGTDQAHRDQSAEIESEVTALRGRTARADSAKSTRGRVRSVRKRQATHRLSCSNCGSAAAPDDRFCSKCGHALT